MKLSIIIITKNRLAILKKCLNSIFKQNIDIFEIIIVDGSDNNKTECYVNNIINKLDINSIYIKQKHGGIPTARNIGADAATGDLIVYFDDDILLGINCIKELLTVFENDINNEIHGATGNIFKKDINFYLKIKNNIWFIYRVLFCMDHVKKGIILRSWTITELPKCGKTEYLPGNFMAFRSEVSNKYKFDENLEKYVRWAAYEDIDFSYRVSRKFKLIVIPKAKYKHTHTGSGRLNDFQWNLIVVIHSYYLLNKNMGYLKNNSCFFCLFMVY